MHVPECAVCGAEAQRDGWVSFEGDRSSQESAPSWPGRPAHGDWFCNGHVTRARELQQRTRTWAIARLRAEETLEQDEVLLDEPMAATDLVARIHANVGFLFEQLGSSGHAEATLAQSRRYNPMDGCVPPDCPFVDEVRLRATCGDAQLTASLDLASWNEREPSGASLFLSVTRARATIAVLAAHSSAHVVDRIRILECQHADPRALLLSVAVILSERPDLEPRR